MKKNYYRVVVADCPWSYKSRAGGSWVSGSAAKYPTMSLIDICNMKVPAIAHSGGSMLFLWATTPLLPEAFRVMKEWGFKYKTTIYWHKIMKSPGMGWWFRGEMEVCLMGIRGDVKAFRWQKPNFIESEVREHSQKPEEFWELVNPALDAHGLSPRVELFCRGLPRIGYDGWGKECPTSVDLEL